MTVDCRGLKNLSRALKNAAKGTPAFLANLAEEEGQQLLQQAKTLASARQVKATGLYQRSFEAGPVQKGGAHHVVTVSNNAPYADYLEYGFRSHFVPGHWEGNAFVYQQNDPAGGMYVGPKGGFVPGKYIMRDAASATQKTQAARLKPKLAKYLRQHLQNL